MTTCEQTGNETQTQDDDDDDDDDHDDDVQQRIKTLWYEY